MLDINLEIKYISGKKNSNSDTLSRYSLDTPTIQNGFAELGGVVATLDLNNEVELKDREGTSHILQIYDRSLDIIVDYISKDILWENEKEEHRVILSRQKFTVLDGILYHIEDDKTLIVVIPKADREHLFTEVHTWTFREHLREAKIYIQLPWHYWWPDS